VVVTLFFQSSLLILESSPFLFVLLMFVDQVASGYNFEATEYDHVVFIAEKEGLIVRGGGVSSTRR